jgi:DNA-3-methyladenine glycosylase
LKSEIIKELISPAFYMSEDVVSVASALLGKIIVTEIDGETTGGLIVETEAYRGPDDRGSHSFGGRYTERTKTMYETGGTVYVYICYGMHPMFNIVTGLVGQGHAVLIRAIQPLIGVDVMSKRRGISMHHVQLTDGPAKLAVALGITKSMDGTLVYDDISKIKVYHGIDVPPSNVVTGLRVGMSVHTGPCAYRPWRFYIKDNEWVSKPRNVKYTF